MNRSILRTLQVGVALLIVAAVTLAVWVVMDVLGRAEALAAVRDVGLLVVLGTGACCALMALAGLGANTDAA